MEGENQGAWAHGRRVYRNEGVVCFHVCSALKIGKKPANVLFLNSASPALRLDGLPPGQRQARGGKDGGVAESAGAAQIYSFLSSTRLSSIA